MKKRTNAFQLGKIAGTEVTIHWTFLLLLFYVFYTSFREDSDWNQGLLALGFLLTVFACITLHELAHITVARRYGYPARKITLYPFGGVASMEKIPEKPYQEFWMALAGPWVNAVIAAVLFLILSWIQGTPEFGAMKELSADTFLYNLMILNISLAAFNLIPAFPTDGGRILRALLAWKMDRLKATKIAARIGQGLALAAIVAGLLFNWWFIVIGVVIMIGASGEALMEVNRAALAKHRVGEIVMRNYTLIRTDDTIGSVIGKILNSQEKYFLIDMGSGHYASVTSQDIVDGLQKWGRNALITEVMKHDVMKLTPELTLDYAFHEMNVRDLVICPVVDHSGLIGVIDLNNIQEFIAFTLAQKNRGNQSNLKVVAE